MPRTVSTSHLLDLTDDCGVFQHASFLLPNRDHGYCLDDNARALLLMTRLAALRPLTAAEARATRAYAAFVHHCWDKETARFRNFMGYDRNWIASAGDDDASARGFGCLAAVYTNPPLAGMAEWARTLLDQIIGHVGEYRSPRAWAGLLIALEDCLDAGSWSEAGSLHSDLAARLAIRHADAARPGWAWWEDCLAYENARLPEAAIRAGTRLGNRGLCKAGLDSLRWLNALQMDDGVFHPVGSDSFGKLHAPPARFDQQSIDTAATVDACLAADEIDGDPVWRETAQAAMDWFDGRNDLGLPLADPLTGICRDGLHPDRVNANAGAESTLCYLLACCSIDRDRHGGAGGDCGEQGQSA